MNTLVVLMTVNTLLLAFFGGFIACLCLNMYSSFKETLKRHNEFFNKYKDLL